MRSGSTLLKALIATRPDASDLPEISFNNITTAFWKNVKNKLKATQRLVIIKKPSFYTDIEYPKIPKLASKKIILIRNPYDTILSLKKMNKINFKGIVEINSNKFLASYWYNTYKSILIKIPLQSPTVLIIRYEDLIAQPLLETSKIFRFIESIDLTPVDTYSKPSSYKWKWGSDDGGRIIKSCKVQKKSRAKKSKRLAEFINESTEIQSILKSYGYEL